MGPVRPELAGPRVLAGTTALTGFVLLTSRRSGSRQPLPAGSPVSQVAVREGWLVLVRRPSSRRRSIPIALGYFVAHYVTLLVLEGQKTFILLSDPLSNGANLLGLTGLTANPWFGNNPQLVALVKVTAVVVGHVLGVVAAHDRAVALFPRRTALLGQLPLLVVMVGYTLGGLSLLFAT